MGGGQIKVLLEKTKIGELQALDRNIGVWRYMWLLKTLEVARFLYVPVSQAVFGTLASCKWSRQKTFKGKK